MIRIRDIIIRELQNIIVQCEAMGYDAQTIAELKLSLAKLTLGSDKTAAMLNNSPTAMPSKQD